MKLKTSNHPVVNPSATQIHENIGDTKKRESRLDNFPFNNPSIPVIRAVAAKNLASYSPSCERNVLTENESIFSTIGKPKLQLNVQLNGQDNDIVIFIHIFSSLQK